MKAIKITAILIAVACVVVGGALIAYWVTYPAYTHRMKVFIEIEDGQEVRSGSGVLEVTFQFKPALGDSGASCDLQGDAIPIELKSGPVVAVLYQYYNEYLPTRAPVDQTRVGFCNMALLAYGLGIRNNQDTLEALASKSGRVQVPPRGIPSFVVFSDPRIPSTGKLVPEGEFSQVLGPGVRLRGVSLELTKEPITRGVIEKVPAVAMVLSRKDKGATRRPRNYEPNPSDFSQGEKT
jgi:hypothetical protein